MATIASIAAEHDMQPYDVATLADLHSISQFDDLDEDTAAFVRDLLSNTDDDGVYRTVMTAAEFQATREALGLTGDWMAAHLNVSPRTVRHWEQGKYAIPEGVDQAVRALDAEARRLVKTLIAEADAAIGRRESVRLTVYRSTEEYHAAEPGATMPASWHRAIAYRVRDRMITVSLAYPNDAPTRS